MEIFQSVLDPIALQYKTLDNAVGSFSPYKGNEVSRMPIILIAIVLATLIVVFYAIIARGRGAAFALAAVVLLMAVYAGVLLSFSLRSEEKVLNLNQEKRFCGLYLDCHLAVSVEEVQKTDSIRKAKGESAEIRPNGIFYIVSVRVSNNAKAATLSLERPEAVVMDAAGKKYMRSLEAEALLEEPSSAQSDFEQPVAPRGGFFTKKIVFDLPRDVQNPRLLVTEGSALALFIELFLAGDEDSLLHKKTVIQL